MIREPLFPAERSERVGSDSAEIAFVVPPGYAYLDGHFPGNPIVPGVTQIGWVVAACRLLQDSGAVGVSRYRFVRPIRPGSAIRVEVARVGAKFECQVFADNEAASKGTVTQSAPPTEQ